MIKIKALKPNSKSKKSLEILAKINQADFHGNKSLASAKLWLACWLEAYPLYQFFVIEVDNKVAGYIVWIFHGGWERENIVLELEQIALAKEFQGQGLGSKLISQSFDKVAGWIKKKNSKMKKITATVWFYEKNFPAKKAYGKFFIEGKCGEREQYGDKEMMMRLRKSV
jgi:GNAT superfamily N-acetyltransferase